MMAITIFCGVCISLLTILAFRSCRIMKVEDEIFRELAKTGNLRDIQDDHNMNYCGSYFCI